MEKTSQKKYLLFITAILIEAVGAWLFVNYGYHWTKIIRYLCLNAFMIVLARIDHEKTIVPNKLLLVMLAVRAILLVAEIISYPEYWKEILISAAGGLIAGLILFLIAYFLSRKSIGMGDVKLAGVLGWYLGLSLIWWDLAVGLCFAGLYCVIQLLRKKLTMKDSIPLVPFLAIGTIAVLLLGF